MNKSFKQIILLGGDLAILHLTLLISLSLRLFGKPLDGAWQSNWPYFLPVFAIWLLVLYIGGAYNLNLAYNLRQFKLTVLNSAIFSSLLSIIYFYINKSEVAPKTILLIFVLVFIILFFSWRGLFNFFIKSYLPKNNIAFIGWNDSVSKLLENIKNQPHHGFQTALVFKTKEEIINLPEIVKERNIHTIVISPELSGDPRLTQAMFDCLPLSVAFYNLSDFYENINGKISVDTIDQSWFIANLNENSKNYFNVFKRSIDIIFSLLALSLSLIFWPIIALAVKLSSKGPVFFTQKRVGKNETVFKMIKFRTMKTVGNNGTMTKENDDRITRVGNFLRKSRLDEIPQIINILKGEMSFIGPRPERPEYVSELAEKIPFYKTRLLIKPGVSGWDQVSGVYHSPSLEDTIEKLQYDLYYLKHRSVYFDIAIFFKTVATVLGRGGR